MIIKFKGRVFRHIEDHSSPGTCPFCRRNTVLENWPPDRDGPLIRAEHCVELLILAGEGLNVGYSVPLDDLDNKNRIQRDRWHTRCTQCGFEWDCIHGN